MSTDRPRLQLSATQILASALAAVTATFAASYLGVAGTVIGAGVASVLTVVGNAVYSHSLQRVARMAPPPAAHRPAQVPAEHPARPSRRSWAMIAAASAGVFVGVLAMVTVVELAAGRPLSDVVRGRSGTGTSVLGDVGASTRTSTPPARTSSPAAPSPAATVTVTPHVVTRTPTVTVTGAPTTVTQTPTVHESTPASSSATPTDTAPAPARASGSTSGP